LSVDFIILAGGFGTRLQSISNGTPKALMPIGDSVYLDLLLERVFEYAISHVYLSLNYRSDLFQDYIDDSIYRNKLSTIIEPQPLGTGGAVKYVLENVSVSSPFFIINGDSLSDINLDQKLAEFEKSNLKAMIGISEVENAERYGTVTEQNGKVLSFQEKGDFGSNWINNGHYIFKKEAFDGFSGMFSLERDLFPKLVQNQELGAFKVANDNFIDMGIPVDYEKLCKMYEISN